MVMQKEARGNQGLDSTRQCKAGEARARQGLDTAKVCTTASNISDHLELLSRGRPNDGAGDIGTLTQPRQS